MDVRSPFFQNIALIVAGVMFLNPIVTVAAELSLDAQAGGNAAIGQAPNGVPVVNIATPNGSGLSHNKFTDYNVGQQGLILNNGAQAFVPTQLGGYITGNPNLKNGAANVILNEVTGSNRSQLKGYTEVAGQSAHVIVANPHGITCDGCGFINTPRATLTTGAPVVDNGRLQGFDVNGGDIAIEGAGLNAGNVDQFDLITRSAKLNAEIHAKRLNVITGRNEVDAATLQATAKADDGSDKPQLAIDSSALGGMYAGAIRLVGTEAGVGVKLAGDMAASAGDIQIDANGQLSLNRVAASGDVTLVAKGVELNADTYAGRNATVTAAGKTVVKESLAGGERVTVQAAQLDNAGTIEAGVRANGSTNSAGHLQLDGGNVRNAGQLTSHGTLNTDLQKLDNQSGKITVAGNATLKAEQLDNRSGEVVAQRNLTFDNQTLDNRKGSALAGQALAIKAESVDNSAGTLAAGGAIEARVATDFNNDGGLVEAGSRLDIKADSLSNADGRLRALGSTGESRFDIGTRLNNDDGLLEVGNAALTFDTESLSNQRGVVRHLGTGGLNLDMELLGQAGGEFITNSAVTLSAEEWVNTSLLQAASITLDIDRLTQTSTGGLLAGNSLITEGESWVNDGRIETNGHIDLRLSGDYRGKGSLLAVGNLDLRADNMEFGTGAQVRSGGYGKLTALGDLVSRGKMTTGSWLALAAKSLETRGTTGAAGQLLIVAEKVHNEDGLIFSGGNLELRTDQLTNRFANIYSQGSLTLVGASSSSAKVLENISAEIESAQDMRLNAEKLLNRRDAFTVSERLLSGSIRYECIDCKGRHYDLYYYVSENFERVVTSDSAASVITAGGNFSHAGKTFDNQQSVVSAAGDVDISVESFVSQGASQERVVRNRTFRNPGDSENSSVFFGLVGSGGGVSEYNKYNSLFIHSYLTNGNPRDEGQPPSPVSPDRQITNRANPNFNPAAGYAVPSRILGYSLDSSTEQSVNIGTAADAIVQAGGKVLINAANRLENGVTRENVAYVDGQQQAVDTAVSGNANPLVLLNAQLPPDLAQKAVDPLGLPSFSLPAGQNGLFSVNTNTQHPYLIETNPDFADLASFLSSDYMIDRLGATPDQMQRRLGDGLYEQKLIRDAIIARTGQRFLAGITSDEQQFRYLMDNAIASKDALNLSLGVALSAEQVAALTHDIVWMEEREVAGQKVLAPVLYMAQANGRLAPTGALIQGQDVALITGGQLSNQGTLRALELTAQAGNVSNAGLMEANGKLQLMATESIRNAQGGIIAGRDVSASALTGDVVNERTVSTNTGRIGSQRWQQDYVDNAARFEATGNLDITAGRDILNRAGALSSDAEMSLVAGRDVELGAVQKVQSSTRGNYYRDERITQYGSDLNAGGNLEIAADRDLSVVASRVRSADDLDLKAGRDLLITSAANESHSFSQSKKVTQSRDQITQQSSVLQAGQDVRLAAGNDLGLVASRVQAGEDVDLDAGQDVQILSAMDENASYYFKKKKGSFGRSKTTQTESYDSTNVASVIEAGNDLTINTSKAANGALNLDGGRDVTVIGSQLSAGNDLLVGGTGDVSVLSGVEEHGSYSKKTKSGFLGLSKSGKSQLKTSATQVASELEAGNDVVIAAGNDIRLRASTTDAGNDVELRAGLVKDTGDINLVSANDKAYSLQQEYKQKVGPSLSGGMLSFASAKKTGQEAQSSTSVGSQVSAERDATLNAERDINIVGSGVSAGRNVALGAGRDVNIVASASDSAQKVWEESQRIGIALGMKSSSPYTSEEERIYVGDAYEATKNILGVNTQSVAPSLIQSGQDMLIDAGRDVQVNGSQLLSGGDAKIEATRDIRIASSTQTHEITETDKTQNYGGGLLKSPAKGPAGIGVMHDVDYLDGYNRATQQIEIQSAISAEGDLTLKSGRDTEIAGANLVADSVKIDAGRDIHIHSPENKDVLYRDVMQGGVGLAVGLRPHEERADITSPSIQPSSIVATSGDITLSAGQDVKAQGAALLADRDVVVEAVRDALLSGASVSYDNRNDVVSNSMASVDRTHADFNSTASAPLEIQAGRDISISAGQDVIAKNLQAEAGRDIDVIAGRDLTIGATHRDRNNTTNSLGIKGDIFGLGEMARAFSEGKSASEILSAAAQSNPLLNNINNIAKTDENEDKWQNAAVLGYRLYSNNPSAGSGESTGSDTAATYGFDLSSGINGRLGYQRSQSEWNEQSGSQLAAGRDVYLEAGRDLALKDGTQVSAVREAYLVGGRDIIIRSAEHASKERSSGGGVTVGYNGGFYFGADGNASRGDSEQYQNASVTAGQALVTDSGRDTTIIGGNLHGGNVQMSVGRNLDLISEQGAIDQKSASASFTVGSQYSANASGSTRDRLAVDRPATITADDRLHIDVAQNTHLKGSQIDSATGNLVLVTETLTHEDLKNSDKAGQGSFSYSGSSDGDTWGNKGEAQEGTGFNAGVPIAKFEGGDTKAAIGEGTIRNHEGEELQTDISRDVAGAHEETDSAAISQYSAKSELLGIAAQKGFEAIGDFANKQALEAEYKATQAEANGNVEEATYWRKQAESWKEGSTNKILLHAVVGALLGEASGVGAVAGGSAAAANQTLSGYLYEFLKEQGVVDGDSAQQRKTIGELTALIVGGVVGGSSGSFGGGASIALHGDKYNRQLHPFELEALRKLAKDESKSPESPLTEQQWYDKLLVQALRQVDSTYAAQLGADDPLAQLVLGRVNISVTDEEGRVIQLFQGGAEFENNARYAEHIRYGAEDYDRALKSWVTERASKTPEASASLIMLINAYRDGGRTESTSSRVSVIDYLLAVKPDVVYALTQAELKKTAANNRGDRLAAAGLERELKELKAVLDETLLKSLNKAKADGILPADLQDMNLNLLSDAYSFDTIMQTWAEDRVANALNTTGYNEYGSLPRGVKGGVSPVGPNIEWGNGIGKQGMPWEDYLASQLPAGVRLPPNFATYDFWDGASGLAISAKTLDTMTLSKITNPKQVYSSLKGNVDSIVKFTGYSLGDVRLDAGQIVTRELRVAIPKTTTAAQWEQVDKAVKYALDNHVILKITTVN